MNLGVSHVADAGRTHPASAPPAAHPYFIRSVPAATFLNARIEFDQKPPQPKVTQAAAKQGLRFEAKVLSALAADCGPRFLPSPCFSFQVNSKRGRAIPDGLLLSQDQTTATIVEIKLRHSGDAWWQLTRFYHPIAQEALRGLRVVLLEICKHYDPSVKLPRPVAFVDTVDEAAEIREAFHPVLVKGRF